MSLPSGQRVQRQRFDAPRTVDLLGHAEGGIQLADAVLLHQLEAFGLLLGLGHRHRQVEAGRHSAEQHFHRLGQDDALAELAGLLACREHQRLLRSVEFAEARDLLDFIGWHRQADPPLDHVEHGLGRFRQVVQVLRGEGGKPVATFLFLGPTGVGKTELAKALAESIYGDEGALLRIDMSEYGERHTVARLVGAPPGYVGYDEGGQLTEKVRRKPYSVLLLDEIEKAHPDVYNILLQVFDDGRLTDGKGRVVDFTNTIIIATSNLGSDIIQRRLKARGAAGEEYEKTKSEVMDVLRGHFRPEFLNRIDEIIVFHALGKEEIRHIVGLQLDRVARNAASQGVTLTFDQTLIDHFAEEGYKPEFGARELKRLIRSELETALAREMLGGGIGKADHASARWDDKAERVVFERQEPAAQPAEPEKPDAANVAEAPPNGESKPARKKKSAGGGS